MAHVSEYLQERYPTMDRLIARAVHLRQLGYTVLIAEARCGHLIGYSAFRSVEVQKRDDVPEDKRLLVLEGPFPEAPSLDIIYKVS